MAWSLVQKSAAQGAAGVATLPGASTAGNLLVASVGNGSATALTAPSGWTTGPSIANGTISEAYLFFYFNNPGGLSSFTFAGGSGAIYAEVAEFTCTSVASVAAASATGTGTAGKTASVTVTTGAGALAGDLVVCSGLQHTGTAAVTTWTDPSGFTVIASGTASQTNHQYGGYRLAAPSGGAQTVTMTNTITSSSTTGWTGVAATFTEPAAVTAALPDLAMAPMTGA